jgi:hypothetical protein
MTLLSSETMTPTKRLGALADMVAFPETSRSNATGCPLFRKTPFRNRHQRVFRRTE